jgi:hypothetical protein
MRISPQRKHARPFAISNIVDHAKFYSRSHDAVIRVDDDAGNVIETHEHKGDFKEPCSRSTSRATAEIATL